MILRLSYYLLAACLLLRSTYAQSPSTFIRGVCEADDGTMLCGDLPHHENNSTTSSENITGHVRALATADGGLNIWIRLYGLPRPDLILTAWLVWVSPMQNSTIPPIFDTVAHRSSPCAPFTARFGNGLSDQGEPNQLIRHERRQALLNVTLNFNPTYPLEGPLTRSTSCLQRDIPGIQSTLLQQFPVTATNSNNATTPTTFIPTSSDYLRVYDPTTGFEQLDAVTGKPVVGRSPVAAAGIEVVSHLDGTTHGISPGVNGVNQRVVLFFPFDNDAPIEYTAPKVLEEPTSKDDTAPSAILVPLPPAPQATSPVRGPEPEFSAAGSLASDDSNTVPPTSAFVTPFPTLEPSPVDAPRQPTKTPISIITNPPFPIYSRNHLHSHSSSSGHTHDHNPPHEPPTKVTVSPTTTTPTKMPVRQPTAVPTPTSRIFMITNPPFPTTTSRNHQHSHGSSDGGHTHNRQQRHY